MLVVKEAVSADQQVTALAATLAAQGRYPLLVFENVAGTRVATNLFSSRPRIARLLGTTPENLHRSYQQKSHRAMNPKVLRRGPVLDVVVLIHTGDGPYSIPTQFYPVIREFPTVQFIIGHFGIQTGGNYSFEAFWMAVDTKNVVCESGWTFQSRIVEFASELPRHKIVFGSDSPPNEPGMWLRELEVLCSPPPQGMNLDEDGLEDYMGNNIARMCGIKTTPPPRSMDEAKARLKDTYAGVK